MTTALKYEDKLKELERFATENWPRGVKEFNTFAALTVDQVVEALAAARESLKHSTHEGECDYESDGFGRCVIHLNQLAVRDERLRAALAVLDQEAQRS